jgi:hypothetical protein
MICRLRARVIEALDEKGYGFGVLRALAALADDGLTMGAISARRRGV